jgi:hypothetical protein
MTDREERLALNEVAFRDVNERVAEQVEDVAGTHASFNVLCECSSTGCALRISITPAEYKSIHADATQFIVVAGHANPEIEDIVDGTGTTRYDIVRKRGDAATVARQADES